jgi:hypothetical protein
MESVVIENGKQPYHIPLPEQDLQGIWWPEVPPDHEILRK